MQKRRRFTGGKSAATAFWPDVVYGSVFIEMIVAAFEKHIF
jgi:hypothetical protein